MDFLELVGNRQSDREFDSTRSIERNKLNRILEAARLAPSACNGQPWHFIVVSDPLLRNQIADATSNKVLSINHFAKQAPVHIVVVEEQANFYSNFVSWAKNKHLPHIDIGVVAAHIILAATAEGLGSCIVGWFDEGKIKKILDIPKRKRVLLDIVIGYSAQPPRGKQRKELSEIVSYNKYE